MSEWVGRPVQVRSKGNLGSTPTCAVLVSFSRTFVMAKPMNHGRVEKFRLVDVRPFWSKNPDLAERRGEGGGA